MSDCNWPLIITKFLITDLQKVCNVYTYYPESDLPYAVLEVKEVIPAIPLDKAKVSLNFHVNSHYTGSYEVLDIVQKLINALTTKVLNIVDNETSAKAELRLRYAGAEHGAKSNMHKFEGLINIK